MAYIVNCLLACALVLTSTMGAPSTRPAPHFGIQLQCQSRGPYAGACKSQNLFGDELTCLRLACAFSMTNGKYRAVYTRQVDDGTLCGINKVCESGVCVTKDPTLIKASILNEPQFDCISPSVPTILPYPPKPTVRHSGSVSPTSSSSATSGSSSSSTPSTSRAGRCTRTSQRRH